MDELIVLLIIVFIIAIIGLTIVLIIYPYKKLRKTRFRKYAFSVPTLIIGFIVYEIYGGVYPSDSFYEDDFESITNISFPQSGKILSKNADFPDQHGHYTSVAVVVLSPEDYKTLIDKVGNDKNFKIDTIIGEGDVYREVTEGIEDNQIKKIVRKGKMVIGFLNDNKRIILERRLSDNY